MQKRYSKRYNKKCYLKMRDFLVTYIEGTNLIFIWLVYLETDHEEKVKSVAACGASAGFTFYERSVIFFIAKQKISSAKRKNFLYNGKQKEEI